MIDFGCCRFLRPAQGCAALVHNYKDDFVAMVCEEYSNQTGSKLSLRDVKAWDCANWVSNVRFAQDIVKDEKQLQAVLNKIAKLKVKESLVDGQGANPPNLLVSSRKTKAPAGPPPAQE